MHQTIRAAGLQNENTIGEGDEVETWLPFGLKWNDLEQVDPAE